MNGRAWAEFDKRDPEGRNIDLRIDCAHYGRALKVLEYAQQNPPDGYRWEWVAIARRRGRGAAVRVTVKYRHMRLLVLELTPEQLSAHPIAAALVEIAEA